MSATTNSAVTLPPWSYTHIDTFEICPCQYHHKYILKNKEPTTPEMEEGRKVHEALEKRVAAGLPLPPALAKYDALAETVVQKGITGEIRTEMKVGVNKALRPTDFFAKDVYGRGALDVAIFHPKKDPTFMFIADWKTGKTREKDFQIKVFAFFGFILFPSVERIGACNIWLPSAKPGTLYQYKRADLPNIWSEIYMKLAAMELAAANNEWKKRQSPLCSYCPKLDCEFNRSKPHG